MVCRTNKPNGRGGRGRDGARPSRESRIDSECPAPSGPLGAGRVADKCPQRKTLVHLPPRVRSGRPTIVFVTVCTDKRKPALCREPAHQLVLGAWKKASSWQVSRYVLMPDHLHLFCSPVTDDRPPLSQWVKYWKTLVSRTWPWPAEQPIWQKSFWDVQLRNGERYSEKCGYMIENPVRKKLAATSEAWPFQEEVNEFGW